MTASIQPAKNVRDQTFGPMRWAFEMPGISANEKLLLLKLTDHDHFDSKTKTRKGVVWPSQLELAKTLNLTPKTIRAALASLETRGLITRIGFARDGVLQLQLNYDGSVAVTYPSADSGADGSVTVTYPGRYWLPTKQLSKRKEIRSPSHHELAAPLEQISGSVTTTYPATTTEPSRVTVRDMVDALVPRDATTDDAIRFAMLADLVLYEDDAAELAEKYGERRVAEMTLLLYARHTRSPIEKPLAWLKAALASGYEFNSADATALRPHFDNVPDPNASPAPDDWTQW